MKILGFDFTKDKDKDYEVTECAAMPSCIGMKMHGKPQLGVRTVLIGGGNYRTVEPINLRGTDEEIIVITKYIEAKLKRIK